MITALCIAAWMFVGFWVIAFCLRVLDLKPQDSDVFHIVVWPVALAVCIFIWVTEHIEWYLNPFGFITNLLRKVVLK